MMGLHNRSQNGIHNKYYKTPNYCGFTYEGLIYRMNQFDRCNCVIDLGFGQGLDPLEMDLIRVKVTGIDILKVGV